jgi:hypothetical protein
MSFTSKLRHRKAYKASLMLLVVAATSAAAVGAKAWFSSPPPTALAIPPRSAAQSTPEQDGPEAEVVKILPTGFEPRQITRPRGGFLLVVSNRTGLDDVDWRLDREAGGRLHAVRMSEGRLVSKQHADLPPGTYVLTEAGHPDWVCRITITPN